MNTSSDRRNFLKATGSVLVAAAASSAVTTWNQHGAAAVAAEAEPSSGTKRRPIKKAVMWGMVAGDGSVLEKFKMVKDAGFDGIELDSPKTIPNEEFKRVSEQTGLLVEGMVDSVHWTKTLSDPDPSVRAFGVESLKTALRDCKALGGTSVLLVPGVVNKQVTYADCYKRSQEEIRKAIPTAREEGVKIAIEDVWNHFLLSPLEAARFVDEFEAPDAVGWHMDLGNIIAYGWPEQWVQVLGKRIVKLHLKEFSRKKQMNEGMGKGFNVELLEGDNDWPTIMKSLDEVGYNTWACLEVPGGGADRMKFLARKLDTILSL